jgi:hypothetical protein
MLPILLILASAAPAAAQSFDADNVVRCVREEVTGSLARTRKVCHTVGEWRKINSDSNDEARRITQPGNMNCMNSGNC